MSDINIKLIDRRTSPRYLQRGKLDEQEYQKYLKALPDLADQAVPLEAEQPGEETPDTDE